MNLKDRAAELARSDAPPAAGLPPQPQPQPDIEQLPDIDIEDPGPDGPEQVPVHVAWSRVMGDIRKIAKGDRFEGGNAGRFDFRGIDRTVNAFGPVLRRHGVLVLPVKVEPAWRDTKTSGGKDTTETRVTVSWMVMGPAGDQLPALLQSAGEALDQADKGTAKAQSVAQRVVLLTAAQVPTGDPDPDHSYLERGEAPPRTAASYRDEALDRGTSRQRMQQIHYELKQLKRLGELVTNDVGDQEQIGPLIVRIGKERFAGGEG